MTIELTRTDELELAGFDFSFKFAGVECFFDGTVTVEFQDEYSWWPKAFSGTMYVGNSGDPEDEATGTWIAGGEIFNSMAKAIDGNGYIDDEVREYVRGYYGN